MPNPSAPWAPPAMMGNSPSQRCMAYSARTSLCSISEVSACPSSCSTPPALVDACRRRARMSSSEASVTRSAPSMATTSAGDLARRRLRMTMASTVTSMPAARSASLPAVGNQSGTTAAVTPTRWAAPTTTAGSHMPGETASVSDVARNSS